MNAARPVGAALDLVYIVDEQVGGEALEQLLAAGVTSLWLRAHHLDGAQLFRTGQLLRERTRAHDVCLIVGGRADVALAVGADGVQLGFRSPPAERVRPWFDGWLGVSCHDAQELERAARAGADYVTLSPVFAVPDKGTPLGVEGFERLRASVDLPVVALGGIDGSNAAEVRARGASGVAVIRALRGAADPAETARALRRT